MRASLSFGGVIFDSAGIRGLLTARFSNFTPAEAFAGWPAYVVLDVREGSENGTTLATHTFSLVPKPSDAAFTLTIDFPQVTSGTVVLVANAINATTNVILGPKATKTVTVDSNGGNDGGGSMFNGKTLLILSAVAVGIYLIGGKKIKW